MNKPYLEICLLIGAFVLPPVILYSEMVSAQFSLHLLGSIPVLAVVLYLKLANVSPRKLGLYLTFASIREILPRTLVLVAGGLFFLAIFPWLLGYPRSLYLEIDLQRFSDR
jgi:hypothetical protein